MAQVAQSVWAIVGYYRQQNNITVCDAHFTVRQPSNG